MQLDFSKVNKFYGMNHALMDFCASLDEGIYALLGPNGAGKTTLMNILVDNLRADSGEILYDNKNTVQMGSNFRKLVGFMPQQQQLNASMSCIQFMYYMAALKGINQKEADSQIGELLQTVNLENIKKKRISTLSGGMKQRLLIAQALLGNPKILILDEPTAGLDPKERIRIRNLISKVSLERIVIFATHVVSDVEFIAKSFLFLKKGKLIEQGSLSELIEKIKGKTFDLVVEKDDVDEILKLYKVSNISRLSDGIHMRILSDTTVEGATSVIPTVDDIYLILFEDNNENII
jgi:ABC-type multidrug transport system ATPase subunit